MRNVIIACLASGLTCTVFAHHSNDYHFDRNVGVTIAGTVTDFRLINPHARLFVDVPGENGDIVSWSCEMAAAVSLRRQGWTPDVFRPGDRIRIQGFAARRNPTECYFGSATMGGGRVITMNDSFNSASPARPELRAALAAVSDPNVPNLSGVWRRSAGGGGGGGGPRLGGPNTLARVLNETGLAALAEYDPVLDDPALDCSPVSIRRLWGNNDLTVIEQTDNLVTIRHEWMDAVREVHMNMNEHPAGTEDRVLGHSIGRYEGSTLVIDTVGYQEGVLAQHPGLPHSNQLHSVERLTPNEAGDGYGLEMTFDDALYFSEPLTDTRAFEASDEVPQRYNCTITELER